VLMVRLRKSSIPVRVEGFFYSIDFNFRRCQNARFVFIEFFVTDSITTE